MLNILYQGLKVAEKSSEFERQVFYDSIRLQLINVKRLIKALSEFIRNRYLEVECRNASLCNPIQHDKSQELPTEKSTQFSETSNKVNTSWRFIQLLCSIV